eukprot:scaffold97693_cov46-Prasinocladus_malaysianus.AAC.1
MTTADLPLGQYLGSYERPEASHKPWEGQQTSFILHLINAQECPQVYSTSHGYVQRLPTAYCVQTWQHNSVQ